MRSKKSGEQEGPGRDRGEPGGESIPRTAQHVGSGGAKARASEDDKVVDHRADTSVT